MILTGCGKIISIHALREEGDHFDLKEAHP